MFPFVHDPNPVPLSTPPPPTTPSIFSAIKPLCAHVSTQQVTTTFGGAGQSQPPIGKILGESEFQRNTSSSSSSSGGRESFGQAEFRRSSSFDDLDFKTPGGWGAHRKPVAAQVQEKKDVSREEKTGGEQAGRVRALAVVGGVAANQELRRRLQVGREWRAGAGRRSPQRPPFAILLFPLCWPYVPQLSEKRVPIRQFSAAAMPLMRGHSLLLGQG